MKPPKVLLLAGVSLLLLLLPSCRETVSPNQTLVVVHPVGDEKSRIEIVQGGKKYIGMNDKAYWFEEGLQSYHFCKQRSFENVADESFTFNCIGGRVTFNLMVQLRLNPEVPPEELKLKLYKLMSDFQLLKYQGQSNLLAKLVADRFKISIMDRLNNECRNRTTAAVFEEKAKINEALIGFLKERFAPYGIEILSAGITSAIDLPADQQKKMNDLVVNGFKLQALKRREKDISPKMLEIKQVEIEGEVAADATLNKAKAEAIRLQAAADAERRSKFKELLGEENALSYEIMRNNLQGLESGLTRIRIVPDNSNVFLGEAPAFRAATGQSNSQPKR